MMPAIQTAAIQALLDLYDRKVTRDEFINNAAPCVTLYGSCSKLNLLESVREAYIDGELSPEKMGNSETALCDLIRKQCEAVIEVVKRLQMCPTSRDSVN